MAEDEPGIRERLVDGAVALIREEGVVDLSVRRLAASGGRSTMCLYTKFGSRQALLEAVYDEVAAGFERELAEAEDPRRAYWSFAVDRPRLYALLFSTDLAPIGLDDGRRTALIERVGAALSEGSGADDAGGLRVWAVLHGRAALAQAGLGSAQLPGDVPV